MKRQAAVDSQQQRLQSDAAETTVVTERQLVSARSVDLYFRSNPEPAAIATSYYPSEPEQVPATVDNQTRGFLEDIGSVMGEMVDEGGCKIT